MRLGTSSVSGRKDGAPGKDERAFLRTARQNILAPAVRGETGPVRAS